MLELGATALVAYLLGSIPSGYLLARLKSIDVRTTGSGNIGATNVARSAGGALGLLTLTLDAAKGALAVVAATTLGRHLDASGVQLARVIAGFAVLVGHAFPVTLGFQGGRGVATALGVLLALAPAALPAPLVLFGVLFLAFRRVSLASIAAAVVTPVSASYAGYPPDVVTAIGAMGALVVLRHRENIGRLLTGAEPRFERPREPERTPDS